MLVLTMYRILPWMLFGFCTSFRTAAMTLSLRFAEPASTRIDAVSAHLRRDVASSSDEHVDVALHWKDFKILRKRRLNLQKNEDS